MEGRTRAIWLFENDGICTFKDSFVSSSMEVSMNLRTCIACLSTFYRCCRREVETKLTKFDSSGSGPSNAIVKD